MKALIISGGDYAPLPEEMSLTDAFVIACDRGYEHARAMGIEPHLILGDFDSAPVPASGNIERHPSHKDDTDTMLAVKRALSLGCTELVIACAFGGRLDHTFANIQSGAYAASHGGTVRLLGQREQAWVLGEGKLALPRRKNCSLSLFSLTDTGIVSVTGTEYECQDLTIQNTFPIGVSNAWKQDEASISVREGMVLVMCSGLPM